MAHRALPPSLEPFAAAHMGEGVTARFCGWAHADSAVWALRTTDGVRAFLKLHRQPRKFRQELYALRVWTPELPEVTPRLLAVHEPLGALLLAAVPGTLALRAPLTRAEEGALYRQAGAFLGRFHRLPFTDTDPLPLADALRRRAAAWARRAAGHVDAATLRWVGAQVAESADLLGGLSASRVPTHGDFTPRNWLVDRIEDRVGGRCGARLKTSVIDFEHSRPDLGLTDLLKLRSEVWPLRPDLEEAFFRGYGRPLVEQETALLARLAALHALSTVVWACEHGDAAFEAQGRALLERLQDA